MSEWQPIDTAPKDGTPVLLYLSEKIDRHWPNEVVCPYYCIGFWQHGRWGSVEMQDCGSMGGEMTGWMEDWCSIDVEPTHWAPLLAPPQS